MEFAHSCWAYVGFLLVLPPTVRTLACWFQTVCGCELDDVFQELCECTVKAFWMRLENRCNAIQVHNITSHPSNLAILPPACIAACCLNSTTAPPSTCWFYRNRFPVSSRCLKKKNFQTGIFCPCKYLLAVALRWKQVFVSGLFVFLETRLCVWPLKIHRKIIEVVGRFPVEDKWGFFMQQLDWVIKNVNKSSLFITHVILCCSAAV